MHGERQGDCGENSLTLLETVSSTALISTRLNRQCTAHEGQCFLAHLELCPTTEMARVVGMGKKRWRVTSYSDTFISDPTTTSSGSGA